MNASTAINLVSLALSALALAVSAFLARRQTKVSSSSHVISVITSLLRELREPAFLQARDYVLSDLRKEHDPGAGIHNLPALPRDRVVVVGGIFEDLGKLVAFRAVDEAIIIGSVGPYVLGVWAALEPYVLKQREIDNSQYWIFFEDLAYRSTRRPASRIRATLGLKRFPSISHNIQREPTPGLQVRQENRSTAEQS